MPSCQTWKRSFGQTKTQGDKWKWITLKIRQSSPFFRDDIATRGEKARETEGLLPGCHYRQSVLSSFYANQHEYAFSFQYLHLQDSLASTAPCRSSPSESDQSDRFKFLHETQDPNEFSQRRNEQRCVKFCLWKTAQSKEVATIMAGQTSLSAISNCQE